MTSRTIPAAILPLVALASLSCSKTQDTPPERRVFGDPPKILSVEPMPPDITKFATCDFTEIMRKKFCELGVYDIDFQAGGGWLPNDNIPDSTDPGVFIEGNYDEINLRVRVTDPNSPPPPGQSNILLVSASFPDPRDQVKEETSLVLFDDGSVTQFKFPQNVKTVGEDCVIDSFGTCQCFQAKLAVTSGDDVSGAGDGLYTRRLALMDKRSVSDQGAQFLLDCIVLSTGATPILAVSGAVYNFKIEEIGRAHV